VQSSVRVLVAIASLALGVVGVSAPAFAAAAGGDRPDGTVTVGASDGGSTGAHSGSGTGQGAGGGGTSPWQCIYTKLVLNDEGGIAPGGPTPGSWYSVTCTDRQTGASTTQTEWISSRAATVNPGVDPFAVALRAENSLRLPRPTTYINPPGVSVVNLSVWLWIDSGIWHPYAVTATVGAVGATAVATPVSVTWSTGDGQAITCHGPGTAFDPGRSPLQQSTGCFHIYANSSAGQPSPDGNPNDAAFTVSATVNWAVSWSAQGATGGGSLPPLTTSSSTAMRVEQVQSVNSYGLSS